MGSQCVKCGQGMEKDQSYEYRGNAYCEDCYMDILSPPKACDPWAVHSARTFRSEENRLVLTSRQEKIVAFIKEKKEATVEEILTAAAVSEGEWKREFAALRHMEVLKAMKKGGLVIYTLFDKRDCG